MAGREDLRAARRLLADSTLVPLIDTVGHDAAQASAHGLASYLLGFVSIELAKTFEFGGNFDDALHFGLTQLLAGLLTGNGLERLGLE